MSIEFVCPQCNKTLRVGSENAGKQARCPQCSSVINVPNLATPVEEIPIAPVLPTTAPIGQPTAPMKRFFVDTDFGETYGPVTQEQLDAWVTEGRVTAQYVIRPEGSQTGVYASQMYPALAASPGQLPNASKPNQAFSAVSPAGKQSGDYYAPVQPTQIDLGDVFNYAWKVFQNNMGLLLGTTIVLTILNFISNSIERSTDNINDAGLLFFAFVVQLVLSAIILFLTVGQIQICLKLVRGHGASFGDLFRGGNKFIPVLLVTLLIMIPGGVVAFGLFLILFMISPFVVLFMFIIVAALLWMLLWPIFFLIIDNKAGVIGSFGTAFEISFPNMLNSFVLFLATIGISLVGLLALCVGVFFAAAYIWVLWTTAYLMMSGQLKVQSG